MGAGSGAWDRGALAGERPPFPLDPPSALTPFPFSRIPPGEPKMPLTETPHPLPSPSVG